MLQILARATAAFHPLTRLNHLDACQTSAAILTYLGFN